jgi:hypothetical protein
MAYNHAFPLETVLLAIQPRKEITDTLTFMYQGPLMLG